jgi:hypothetical protein
MGIYYSRLCKDPITIPHFCCFLISSLELLKNKIHNGRTSMSSLWTMQLSTKQRKCKNSLPALVFRFCTLLHIVLMSVLLRCFSLYSRGKHGMRITISYLRSKAPFINIYRTDFTKIVNLINKRL